MANKIEILSVQELLDKSNLQIPPYQRPYKWSRKNIEDLLTDIDVAILHKKEIGNPNYKYRVGTILLHNNTGQQTLDIIDGQQRTISFFLLLRYLNPQHRGFINMRLDDSNTKFHLCDNYVFIRDWFALKGDEEKKTILESFTDLLEVVVITVEKQSEAFQLFDSQNSRGKSLYPHDLLKAYHLREMKDDLFEMKQVVEKWENLDRTNKRISRIALLFDNYLFPIDNWAERKTTKTFTDKDIDEYKGIKPDCKYPFALRASKSMPVFQITEPFIAGKDFFDFVIYYLSLLYYLKDSVLSTFKDIKDIIKNNDDHSSGYGFCKELFYCSVLCYYDRFKNLDEKAIKKLFTWAFMLRVDKKTVNYAAVNRYARGEQGNTNSIAMFYRITHAQRHNVLSNMPISILRHGNKAERDKWNGLYNSLKSLNGLQ